MKERNLFKISLIGAVLGVIILYFYASQVEIGESLISKLDGVPEGDSVLVRGVVQRVTNQEKVAFLEVAQEEIKDVTVVLFKNKDVNLVVGDLVEVEGTVESYQGRKEIIANRVEVK